MFTVDIHPGVTVEGEYIDLDESIFGHEFQTEEQANDYAKSVVAIIPTAEATVYIGSLCECCGDVDLDRYEGRKHQATWDAYHAARRVAEDAAKRGA